MLHSGAAHGPSSTRAAAHDEQQEEFDENGARVMSRKAVQRLLRSRGSYFTPQFNTTLFLNNLRFGAIAGLEDFTGCKVLHLENNCLKRIEGLAPMCELKTLYLQNNDISRLEGLECCTRLDSLDISGNPLVPGSLRGLPPCLTTLHAAGIGLSDADDIARLSEMCPDLQVLDLSRNRLQAECLSALCKLLKLRVLYCKENPVARAPNYRRVLISSLPSLSYLDDSPIDEMERRGAEAWVHGGKAAEAAARLAVRDERHRAARRRQTTFAVERAQRRIMRELSGSVGSDERLGWVLQALDGPMQHDTVRDLVARLLGHAQHATVPPEALDVLPTGLYEVARSTPAAGGSAAASDGPGDAAPGASTGSAASFGGPRMGLPSSGSEECVVCSEELEAGSRVMWLPCTHVFHERCIRQWLTGFSDTCPTCRARVPTPASNSEAGGVASVATGHAQAAAGAASESSSSPMPTGPASARVFDSTAAPAGVVECAAVRQQQHADDLAVPPPPSAAGAPSGSLSFNRLTLSILTQLAASLAATSPTLELPVSPPATSPPTHPPPLLSSSRPSSPSAPPPAAPSVPTPTAYPPPPDSSPKDRLLLPLPRNGSSPNTVPTRPLPSNTTSTPRTPQSATVEGAPTAGPAVDPQASVAGGASDEAAVPELGCGAANSLEDPMYQQLQEMYKRNFGQKSKVAEARLADWNSLKEARRRRGEAGQQQGLELQSQQHSLKQQQAGTPQGTGEQDQDGEQSPENEQRHAQQQQLQSQEPEPVQAGLAGSVCAEGGASVCGAAGAGQRQVGGISRMGLQPKHVEAAAAVSRQQQQPRALAAPRGSPPAAVTAGASSAALSPVAAPSWHLQDSPVQSVLRAVSSVMQQRRGAQPGAAAAAAGGGGGSSATAATGPVAAGAAVLTASRDQRMGQQVPPPPQQAATSLGPARRALRLSGGEEQVAGVGGTHEDPWVMRVQAATVPYL